MKWLTKFFDLIASAYQASSFQETIIDSINHTIKRTEKQIVYQFTQFKKKLALTLAEFVCYLSGFVLILVGIVVLLNRWVSLDVVLLISGAIIIYVGLMLKVLQK